MIYTHTHAKKFGYITGMYKSVKVPFDLIKKMMFMATPLIFNETLWAAGIAVQTQIYSARGLSVVAGLNINSTIYNVFNIAFIAMGDAVAIIVGQLLGAGKNEEATDTAYKIISFSTVMCIGIGAVLYFLAPLFPEIYNTTDEVKEIAAGIIRISAIMMPVNGFLHSTYFTIRSGGKTIITFLFDSVFTWVVSVSLAFILCRFTVLPVLIVYLFVQCADIIKVCVGYVLVRKGIWVTNLVTQ